MTMFDLLAERHGHHRLESAAQQRRPRDREILVLPGDRPALPLCELAADAELVGNRGVALVL